MSVRAIIPRQRLFCPLTQSPKLHQRFSTSLPQPAAKLSIHPTPSPPRLPPSEQAIFEELVQRSSVAGPFSTPPPSTQQQQQAGRDPRSQQSVAPDPTATPQSPPQSRYTADTPPRPHRSGTPSDASSQAASPRPATASSSTPASASSSSSSSGSPGPEPGRLAPRSQDLRGDRPVTVDIDIGAASSDTTGSGAVTTPLHPDVRRGAPPEFEGERNPKTGELGGPKNEPLRWGSGGDWSYNGRVTDF